MHTGQVTGVASGGGGDGGAGRLGGWGAGRLGGWGGSSSKHFGRVTPVQA